MMKSGFRRLTISIAESPSWASPTFQFTYLKAERCSMGVSEFWWVEDPHLPSIPMERCMMFVTSKCTEQGGVIEEKSGKKFCKLPAKLGPAFEKLYGPSNTGPTIPGPKGALR